MHAQLVHAARQRHPVFAGPAGRAPISVLRQHIQQQNHPVSAGCGLAAFTTGLKAGALAAT